ncbi:hypothetical protein CRYUN_Cryun03dG0041200 [Craigia yunnanensis]
MCLLYSSGATECSLLRLEVGFDLVLLGTSLGTSEIDQNSSGIMEEIEKCKDSALERKKSLEEEKEQFQKAAYTVWTC